VNDLRSVDMATRLAVPVTHLKEMVSANTHLLEVAQSLTELADRTGDPEVKKTLMSQIVRFLDSSDKIGAAIMSSESTRVS
jgi:hypothetical protein